MPLSANAAVTLGGIANLTLAVIRIFAIAVIRSGKSLPIRVTADGKDIGPAGAAFMVNRQVFIPLAFGLLSLVYAHQFAATPLGLGLALVIGVFLLLRAAEHFLIPELRKHGSLFEGLVALVGGVAYSWAVVSGI
jgi:hypothetical protein